MTYDDLVDLVGNYDPPDGYVIGTLPQPILNPDTQEPVGESAVIVATNTETMHRQRLYIATLSEFEGQEVVDMWCDSILTYLATQESATPET